MVHKIEWEAIKRREGNKCIVCGKTEKSVGKLIQTHLKARSKGGTQILPMCPTHHTKYDDGKFTDRELEKIGVLREDYEKYRPKRGRKVKEKGSTLDNALKTQSAAIKKAMKEQEKAIKGTIY